jgi:hypothetical protein
LPVENPSGISEVESFRFQPVLRSNEIVISLGQDHAADSERGDSNQRSLHNCGIARSSRRRRPRLCSQRKTTGTPRRKGDRLIKFAMGRVTVLRRVGRCIGSFLSILPVFFSPELQNWNGRGLPGGNSPDQSRFTWLKHVRQRSPVSSLFAENAGLPLSY